MPSKTALQTSRLCTKASCAAYKIKSINYTASHFRIQFESKCFIRRSVSMVMHGEHSHS